MMSDKDFNRFYLDILNNLALLSSFFDSDTRFSPSSDVATVLDSLSQQIRSLRCSLVTVENDLFNTK